MLRSTVHYLSYSSNLCHIWEIDFDLQSMYENHLGRFIFKHVDITKRPKFMIVIYFLMMLSKDSCRHLHIIASQSIFYRRNKSTEVSQICRNKILWYRPPSVWAIITYGMKLRKTWVSLTLSMYCGDWGCLLYPHVLPCRYFYWWLCTVKCFIGVWIRGN